MNTSQSRGFIKGAIATAGLAIIGTLVFIYSGVYPIGADVEHNKLTLWSLEVLRDRSIANASEHIPVPENLQSADRLLAGGADYNDMCAGCHLKPGRSESDFTLGLYPVPPNLTLENPLKTTQEAQNQRRYWVIKHGIKASGMPAWAPGHDDERIWNMVAFLNRLPELTPAQYQVVTSRGDEDMGHH